AFYLARDRNRDVWVIASRQAYDNPGARLAARERVDGVHICRVWTMSFGRKSLPGRALDYLSFYASAALMLYRVAARGDIVVAQFPNRIDSYRANECGGG